LDGYGLGWWGWPRLFGFTVWIRDGEVEEMSVLR
jgi:hypothetical protein